MRAEIKQQIEESVKNQFEASMQMSWREVKHSIALINQFYCTFV